MKDDEFKDIWERKGFSEHLKKIVKGQRDLAKEAFISFAATLHCLYSFRESDEENNFLSYVRRRTEEFYRDIQDPRIFAFGTGSDINDLENIDMQQTLEYWQDKLEDIWGLMVSENYQPPKSINELFQHMAAMWAYYNSEITLVGASSFPEAALQGLFSHLLFQLSFCKLLFAGSVVLASLLTKGRRDLQRVKIGKKAIKALADKKNTYVYHIYFNNAYKDRIKKGMKFHAVAREVKKIFESEIKEGKIPRDVNLPSIDQIKRYLLEDKRIEGDFKKDGRYWIMQT